MAYAHIQSMTTLADIETRAQTMTDSELHFARMDAVKAAEAMDKLDRIDGQDRAGRYRDEASTYAGELRRRAAR